MIWQSFSEAFGLAMFAVAGIALARLAANTRACYPESRAAWALPLLMTTLPLAVFCVSIAGAS